MKSNLNKPLFIAGPCSVDSYEDLRSIVGVLAKNGVEYIRGGIYKPRTSPYDYQGLGDEGLKIFKDIKQEFDVKIVSELVDVRKLDKFIDVVDVVQIGTRSMYNYPLLTELGQTKSTIILKRGLSATLVEWLYASEYILNGGNTDVILCERGIRTFNNHLRNTLDLSIVPMIKQETDLRIIVDPSHGTGKKELIRSMSLASIACGADGLIIETHINPISAKCDSEQAITLKEVLKIKKDVDSLYEYLCNE